MILPREELKKKHSRDLKTLDALEDYLRESFQICSTFDPETLSRKDLREVGALTDRFQRAQDFFVTHTLRAIDALEGESGTTLDVLNRSEQRRIIDSSEAFIDMRSLRNTIAHEYAGYGPADVLRDVLRFTPILLESFSRVRSYPIP
ncbi:MAG TPA: hypothetical protein VFD13_07255 [Candidatus Kapabacteria bacterium]|nr:hypothetical protein [Candidatus Kapabacteria bacterium]